MLRAQTRLLLVDVLMAAALAVWAAVEEAHIAQAHHPWPEIVAALWMAPILVRGVAPLVMSVAMTAGCIAYALVGAEPPSGGLWSFLALLIVTFSLGSSLEGRRRWWAAALLLAGVFFVNVMGAYRPGGPAPDFADTYLSPLVLVGGPLLAGMLLRRSRHQTAELLRLSTELESEREAHAHAAAAYERNRIARELHDVISHSVGVMLVQTAAAEQRLPEDSPAREQLLAVRRTGREAMAELRRQLGALRDGPADSPAPPPDLHDVAQLAADDDVSLEYDEKHVGRLPSGLALVAYRVVQESLTNTRKHAAGSPVRVRVGREGDRLAIEVLNGPGRRNADAPTGVGFGLAGMRERVELYAGQLESGRTAEGGWRVRARLPIPADPSTYR